MSPEESRGTERCEPMVFRLGYETVMTAWLPAGALPTAQQVLDLIAPPDPGWNRYTKRACPESGHWTVPEDVSLAAVAVLPHRTLAALLAAYPCATAAAREHIGKALHDHCEAELADFEESALLALRGMPPVGFAAGATAAQVANAVAARNVLDAAFGTDHCTPSRAEFLSTALYHYEHGTVPDRDRSRALDAYAGPRHRA